MRKPRIRYTWPRYPTKFSFSLWHWTMGHESLFELSKDEFEWYEMFVQEAER